MSDSLQDTVESPAHYRGDGEVDCMRAMASAMSGDLFGPPCAPFAAFWWGCAFKYLWRWPRKNGAEDLLKCRRCIDYLIEEVRGGL